MCLSVSAIRAEGSSRGSENDDYLTAALVLLSKSWSRNMGREKQRCTATTLEINELLGHEGGCVHDIVQSSDGYNNSSSACNNSFFMLPIQAAVEVQQDKHRERDAHSSLSRSIYTHPDPAYTSVGRPKQAERKRQRDVSSQLCAY